MGSASAARYGARSAEGAISSSALARPAQPGDTRSKMSTSGKSSPAASASTTGSRKTPNEQASRRMARRAAGLSR